MFVARLRNTDPFDQRPRKLLLSRGDLLIDHHHVDRVASLDLLLVNLKLWGAIDNDLTALADYVRVVSEACQVPIPRGYPVFGSDAFETATGVHAAAVIKAFKKNDTWLANRVYSGVPADAFGREQKISIGHMSGRSNVLFWLEKHDIEATERLVDAIFLTAKQSNRLLTDAEILEVVRKNQNGA